MRKHISDAQSLDSLPTIPTPPKLDRRRKRKAVRWGLIAGNLILLVGVGAFILVNRSASQTIRSGTVNSVITTTNSLSSPLDIVSSSQIALSAAQMTDLPELTAVRNQNDSETAQLAVAASDETIVAKPQLVNTTQKSKKDIVRYKVVARDTVSSIAEQFNINAQSIRWSNNIAGEAIAPGRTLLIPPANGIVYRVKPSDTVDSVARRYNIDKAIFVTVNDAESGSLKVGEYVWLPGGSVAAPSFNFSAGVVSRASSFGSCGVKIPGVTGQYDCGYCTWWAAYRRYQIGNPVPGGLGNAYSWYYRYSGNKAKGKPQAGAVIWFNGNHVGFVEKVNGDGTVLVSEMNHAGWDVKSYRTMSAGEASRYGYLY